MKLLFSIIFLFSSVFSTLSDEEKVPWREGKKLRWEMFKGQPENIGGFVASTNSGISVSFNIRTLGEDISVTYNVQSYFYPNESWYKSGKVTKLILAHEQTHFDISELFARKLRKYFQEIPKDKGFEKQAQLVYKENEQARIAMQNNFDEATDHSRIEEIELQWEAFIQEQLIVYNDWK